MFPCSVSDHIIEDMNDMGMVLLTALLQKLTEKHAKSYQNEIDSQIDRCGGINSGGSSDRISGVRVVTTAKYKYKELFGVKTIVK